MPIARRGRVAIPAAQIRARLSATPPIGLLPRTMATALIIRLHTMAIAATPRLAPTVQLLHVCRRRTATQHPVTLRLMAQQAAALRTSVVLPVPTAAVPALPMVGEGVAATLIAKL